MKRLAAFAAFLLAAAPGWAQPGMGGMDMKDHGSKDMMGKPGQDAKDKSGAKKAGKKAAAKVHKGSGTPTKVDTAAGKVTIDHGPIPTLNWPAMSMTFSVKDKAMLDHVHEGGKVEFEFVQQGPDYVITKIH